MESQKGSLPDTRFAEHHVGWRVLLIRSPKRGVFWTVGLSNTIRGGEWIGKGIPKGGVSGQSVARAPHGEESAADQHYE